jgi:hypothetical protein
VTVDAQQPIALAAGLARHAELTLGDVAEAAVNELRGAARGAGGEVLALDEQRAQAARGGVAQHGGARDAAAHHQQVDAVALCLGESAAALVEAPGGCGHRALPPSRASRGS